MFSFPWPSAARNEKVLSGKANLLPIKAPVSETPTPFFNKMKRKREDGSPTSTHLDRPAPKRSTETMTHIPAPTSDMQRAVLPVQAPGTNGQNTSDYSESPSSREVASEGVAIRPTPQGQYLSDPKKPSCNTINHHREGRVQHSSTGSVDISAFREAIEAQFGLEILLKHKELRLIDQELAKCQIGLEQLRRCQVIPYPASSSTPEVMQSVSSGSGTPFNNRAPYASPWGVTDGPYSRHYQRWLIPDSAFDENFVETTQVPTSAGKTMPERATRGSKYEMGAAASKSRSHRGSNAARLKALPHGYPEPKEEKGPMIVKRGSDGKMVKLVCLDCRRSNFNSAQGFINHCRIAHSRQFQNHDSAIEASGEEVDMDAEGSIGEINSSSQAIASSALVHPLIRSSAHLARTTSTEALLISSPKGKRSQANCSTDNPPTVVVAASQTMSTPQQQKLAGLVGSDPFTPSPQTPHLSALFAKLGRGGDLEDMVNQAKERADVDLSLSSDDEEDDTTELTAGTVHAPQSRSTRGVLRGGHMPVRQTKSPAPLKPSPNYQMSYNGSQKPAYLSNFNIHQAFSSPYHSDGVQEDPNSAIPMTNTPFNLSPNTIEAHTAPSLVSDDGDYGNTHSESESPSSAEADDDDHYIPAELMDHEDMDLGQGSSAAHHIGLGGKPHTPIMRRRSSAMRSSIALPLHGAEQRHVSFASPARTQRRDSRTTDPK